MKPGLAYRLPPPVAPEVLADLRARFDAFVARRRASDLEGAALLREVGEKGLHFHEGAASIAEFAEAHGLSIGTARELDNLGLAVRAHECVAKDVESGRMHTANAEVLGRMTKEPDGFVREGENWVEWAVVMDPRSFLRRFQERRDEVRQGEPVRPLLAYLTEKGHADFETARKLASRSAQKELTAGQTITIVVEEYLARHDPLRRKHAARRLPDTASIPNSRRIPAEVDGAVRKRSGDRCAVKGCRNGIFVHRSHRTPHRDRGTREADNIDLLCARHHALFEQGMIRLSGPPDARVFTDANGNALGSARRPGAPRETASPESPGRPESRDRPATPDSAP